MESTSSDKRLGLNEAEEQLVRVMDGVMDTMRALEKARVFEHHDQLIKILISVADEIETLNTDKKVDQYTKL